MELALPGLHVLFRHMLEDLHHVNFNMVTLKRGMYEELNYFRWLAKDIDV